MTALEILQPGPLALIQDRGRPGLAHLGVTRSGAADRAAHALANRLVANPHDRATIEVTMGGLVARARDGDTVIAVTGADPRARIGSIPFGLNSVVHLRAGEVVHLDVPRTGMRSYLAVRGGVEVPPVLGSRSYDVLSGIGPAPLRAGDIVVIGEHGPQYPEVDLAPVAPLTDQLVAAAMMRGPRDDWISDVDGLVRDAWTVSDRSDRIGMRLHGRPLTHRAPGRQLPSEGAVRGAIQVPPNGLPVILGPDHPVTGGYPVIGVVVDRDLDALAQVRAGQPLRLRWAHS